MLKLEVPSSVMESSNKPHFIYGMTNCMGYTPSHTYISGESREALGNQNAWIQINTKGNFKMYTYLSNHQGAHRSNAADQPTAAAGKKGKEEGIGRREEDENTEKNERKKK